MKQKEVSKQIVENNDNKKKNRREGRGRVLALSRHVYQLRGKDTFYVESESCDSRYYFVRFNSSFAGGFCSCRDYDSNRSEFCKHQHGVFYAIKYNTVLEVDRLPEEVRGKRDSNLVAAEKYKNESIRTSNDLEKAETEQQAAVAYRTNRLSYEEDTYSF